MTMDSESMDLQAKLYQSMCQTALGKLEFPLWMRNSIRRESQLCRMQSLLNHSAALIKQLYVHLPEKITEKLDFFKKWNEFSSEEQIQIFKDLDASGIENPNPNSRIYLNSFNDLNAAWVEICDWVNANKLSFQ